MARGDGVKKGRKREAQKEDINHSFYRSPRKYLARGARTIFCTRPLEESQAAGSLSFKYPNTINIVMSSALHTMEMVFE